MKLLEAISSLKVDDLSCLVGINRAIQDRLFWLEMREPESDGAVYDAWDDKYSEFEEIAELSEDILDNISSLDYDMKRNIEELKELVEDFQVVHGGLSRLKI